MDEEKGEIEKQELSLLTVHEEEEGVKPSSSSLPESRALSGRFWWSASVNTLATAGIVFINKRIFDHAALRHAQVAFAAWHFTLTAAVLYILSRPRLNLFQAKRVDTRLILPIASAMILNVVLPNAALAYSSIQFYQVARVLVTPCIVVLNYLLYRTTIAAPATLTLVLVCVGVAVLSYYDTMPAAGAKSQSTTFLGVSFALGGVMSTAIYTVWIKTYHKVLDCNSLQLLLNSAPVGVLIMLYVIPFSDDVTAWKGVDVSIWVLIAMSGGLACLINVTQFIIIDESGAVSSSVVGHFKTCFIVLLSWIVSRKSLTAGTLAGVVLALGGIISYSYVTQRQSRN